VGLNPIIGDGLLGGHAVVSPPPLALRITGGAFADEDVSPNGDYYGPTVDHAGVTHYSRGDGKFNMDGPHGNNHFWTIYYVDVVGYWISDTTAITSPYSPFPPALDPANTATGNPVVTLV
jgi:hypothetical protein